MRDALQRPSDPDGAAVRVAGLAAGTAPPAPATRRGQRLAEHLLQLAPAPVLPASVPGTNHYTDRDRRPAPARSPTPSTRSAVEPVRYSQTRDFRRQHAVLLLAVAAWNVFSYATFAKNLAAAHASGEDRPTGYWVPTWC